MRSQQEAARARAASPGEANLAPSHDAAGRGLYERLLAGDPTAPADLARDYLDGLVAWLSRFSPGTDPRDRQRAAEDAILALLREPDRYRPDRQRLNVYLRVSAAGDLKDPWRAQRAKAGRGG